LATRNLGQSPMPEPPLWMRDNWPAVGVLRSPVKTISSIAAGPIGRVTGGYLILSIILIVLGLTGIWTGTADVVSAVTCGIICGGPVVGIITCARTRIGDRAPVFWTAALLYIAAAGGLIPAEVADVIRAAPDGMRLSRALYLSGAVSPIAGAAGALMLAGLARSVFAADDAFKRARMAALGDARWLSISEVRRLFPSDVEIVIGEAYRPDQERAGKRAFDPKATATWGSGGAAPVMTYKLNFDSTHMLFFAGSGGFKTTSTVVPTALRYTGSMVVLDPACEVGGLVSAHRRRMKRTVRLLDPMQSDGNTTPNYATRDGCNVLEPLLASSNIMADTVAFAKLLVAETAKKEGGSAAFFEAQAHNLMTGLLFYVLLSDEFCTGGPGQSSVPSLRNLRQLTSMSEKDLKAKIGRIVGRLEGSMLRDATADEHVFLVQTLSPYVAMADQTWTGIASSVAKDTQWLSIPSLAALVCNRTFKASDLLGGDLDVFIQIPGELLKAYPGVGRTLIGAFCKTMVDARGSHAKRVLLVLDEVDLLGYMGLLEEIRDRGRKYGLTLMLMYQSVGQLEKHFGKDGATSWFEGCSFASYASVKSMETAKALSAQCGDVTVEVEGRSVSGYWTDWVFAQKGQKSSRVTASVNLQKRPLILPHEVREMRADEQILMVRGYPAIRAGRAIYFRRPEMAAAVSASGFK
jgi:type IV secretion system protein VirD4